MAAAITVQDGGGVSRWLPVDASLVAEQLQAAVAATGARVVKTGMLGTAEVVEAVAAVVAEKGLLCVCDPVVSASGGQRLISERGISALKQGLLPAATLATPNLPEAALLTGMEPHGLKGMEEAARRLAGEAGCAVLLTGGHWDGSGDEVVEILALPSGSVSRFHHRRRPGVQGVHGTGCALSAAIAALLARGMELEEAVDSALSFIDRGLAPPVTVGPGLQAVDTIRWGYGDGERFRVIEELERAWDRLAACPNAGRLIPEIQSNLAYGLPGAATVQDVAAFPGRIVRMGERVVRLGCPRFGASSHVARIVITAHAHDPGVRSAMAVRYDEALLRRAEELGLSIGTFSRSQEPKDVKEREGSTLVWGVRVAIEAAGGVPDLIYDLGDVGKEPVIRVLGRNPVEVVEKAISLLPMEEG